MQGTIQPPTACRERWLWIGGWGLPPAWLQEQVATAFSDADHVVIPPGPASMEHVAAAEPERIGGFSLGSFLLLKNRERILRPCLILSPFFGYTEEMKLGGRIREVQVRFLSRWLQRDPLAALDDFYRRAGLDLPPPDELPYPLEDLVWGLEQLATERTAPALPPGWEGLTGRDDPFLASDRLHELEPRLQVVPGAGHHPASLLAAWAGRGKTAS
jgi:hypothetical protein